MTENELQGNVSAQDVLDKLNEGVDALQDAQQTLSTDVREALETLAEHDADPNAHGGSLGGGASTEGIATAVSAHNDNPSAHGLDTPDSPLLKAIQTAAGNAVTEAVSEVDSPVVALVQGKVDDAISSHEAAENPHHIPPATPDRLGMVRIGQGIGVDENGVISTEPVTVATTAKAGIVQLSSALDSTSETVAATPKAVKAAYDKANEVANAAASAATVASEAKTAADNAQQAVSTSKSVTLKSTRSTGGDWTITGLTVGVPLFILARSENTGAIYATISVVSGSDDGNGVFSLLCFHRTNSYEVHSSDVFVAISTSSSVVITVDRISLTLRAYQ